MTEPQQKLAEPQAKASDEQTLHEGLKAVRIAAEGKDAELAETKQKVDRITTDLADIHEKQQKAFELEAAKTKANEEGISALTNKYDALYKQSNRIGFGANDNKPEDTLYKKYAAELDTYFRKGDKYAPNLDLHIEIANDYVAKALITQDDVQLAHHKSLLAGSSLDGGFLIFPDRRTDFQINRIFETSPLRSVARTITTTGSEVEIIVNDDEFDSGGWVGEVQSRVVTDTPKIHTLMIATHEQFAQPRVSQKMLDDSSINIEQFIMDGVDRKLARTENTAFVTGDGANKPRGFLDLPAWSSPGVYQRDALERINSGVDGVVRGDGVIDLQNGLIQEYQANAVFVMQRKTWGDILKLKDGVGNYQLQIEMLKEGTGMLLLGKRVIFADDMPEVASDSESIAYGDFGVGYTIVDRLGIRVLRDPLTDKPFIKFYSTKRVGGAVTSFESIKIQKLAA